MSRVVILERGCLRTWDDKEFRSKCRILFGQSVSQLATTSGGVFEDDDDGDVIKFTEIIKSDTTDD